MILKFGKPCRIQNLLAATMLFCAASFSFLESLSSPIEDICEALGEACKLPTWSFLCSAWTPWSSFYSFSLKPTNSVKLSVKRANCLPWRSGEAGTVSTKLWVKRELCRQSFGWNARELSRWRRAHGGVSLPQI